MIGSSPFLQQAFIPQFFYLEVLMVYFECCNILSCSVYLLQIARSLLSRRIIGVLYQDIYLRRDWTSSFFAASLCRTIFLPRGTNEFWVLQYFFLQRVFLAHSYVLIGALHQDIVIRLHQFFFAASLYCTAASTCERWLQTNGSCRSNQVKVLFDE